MIYLQEGNFPLNEAFSSEIAQEANSTYQLTFKFPTSDPKWALLTPETELVADDLHGEQYFTIFEVEKQHGYVTVYANQVATLLNGYSINKINVDRVNGATVMNALVAGFKRETPFTFFSDVMSKHTLNLKDISAMEALAKDKHSIIGQWGGDLVRDKYSVRLLENGGIENESLFAYKKNMKSFQESKSTKELRTRIHFKKVIEAHEEGKKDQILTVTIDSPLINKYKHIYEADMEVQDQDVVDQKTLEEYGKRYFRETLCDMIEESLEIDVVGQADQPVHMFDIVSLFHEIYNVDLRKKITKYKFNPMSIKLVSIGFGEVARTLADSISGMVNDSFDKKMKSYDAEYEAKVQKLVDNANAEYDKQAKELEHKITDGIEQAKAQAEVVKQEISAKVTEKINAANQANKNEIVEEFKAQYNGIEVKMQGLKATTDQLKTSDADIQKLINDFKTQTQSQFVGIQGAQSRFEQTTEKAISDLTNVANGKADRSYVEQTVNGIKEQLTSSRIGGPNLIRDTAYKEGTKYFVSNGITKIGNHPFYFNGSKPILIFSNNDRTEKGINSNRFLLEKNTDYTLNFRGFNNSALTSYDVFVLGRRNGETQGFTIIKQLINGKKLSISDLESVSVQFNSGDIDNAYLRFDNNGTNGGQSDLYIAEIDLYKGTQKRPWQPAPEDQEYLVTQAQATFERTIQGLSTQLTQLESKAGPNGELEQRMLTYSEKAAVDALKATRQILEQGYIAKAKYEEDVAGINRRFESVATDTTPDNLIRFADTLTEYSVPNNNNNNRLSRPEDGIFKMKIDGSPSTTWLGPCFPIYIDRILQGDVYSIAFDYMIKSGVEVDKGLAFALKNHSNNTAIFGQGFADKNTPKDRWIRAEFHFTANRDFEFNKTGNFPFYIYAINNGEFWIRNPILVRGSKIPAFRPSPLDKAGTSETKIESKIAEYKQTVDGQFTTITNQMGDMLRKTDIQITPGQISFGVGKEISGRTISSLLVQEPESIALIAKLIKVKGDMVVDGSILGRHIASESVETGHMKAGSVTTPILSSNSVTADKVLVDSAMIDKLVSNQAFIRELMAQKAFITQLASIDFSAERISGGRILSNKGAMKIDLDNSEIDFNENARIEFKSGKNVLFRQRTHPQKKHNTIGALMFKDSVHGGVATTLGNTSHKWINEMTDNPSDAGADGSFAGIRIFRDSRETPYDRVELVGDRIQFRHSVRQNGGLQFQTTGFTVPSHGEGGHAGAWNLGVLLEHFRQNFEIIRKKNPSWGLNIYGFPFYNINSDQTIPFDQYI
ncbi:phage tail protein [Streptococcus parasanguinis]|uniref:phage tail spike protein n=1 Tax=Streptococcus parasanguinis TaxID=1318 RepID=UPI0019135888|nr:phage tail spike protein [Streptococcus parasanguinis]MBK5057828.1 phage tail protein [Streptococcus parasanguinis]